MPTKTFRSSVTRKILEDFDNPFPGIVAASTIKKSDLVEDMVDYQINGWFSRAENFYKTGKNYTVRGLPSEFALENNVNIFELRKILTDLRGNKIIFNYAFLDTIDEYHFISQYLQDVRHINPLTFVVPPAHIPSGLGEPIDLGSSFTYVSFTTTALNDGFILKYSYHSSNSLVYFEETIPKDFLNDIVYQVSYFDLDENLVSNNIPKYWTYAQGDGDYPTLDVENIITVSSGDNYYPIVPFYIDKFEVGNEANSGLPIYNDSKKLIKKLGFDYEDLVSSLAEGTEESIGKNKGLWAYLYLGVNVTEGILNPSHVTTDTANEIFEARKKAQASLRYLFEFFKEQGLKSKYSKSRFDAWKLNPLDTSLRYNSFKVVNEDFHCEVDYMYIHISTILGNIGNTNWCESEFIFENTRVIRNLNNPESIDNSILVDTSKIVYRMQTSDTHYTQIEVRGLFQKYLVKGNYVGIYPIDAFNENADEIAIATVPLNRTLVKEQIPFIYRNRLIHSSLNFVFNAYLRVEVKWYQTMFATFLFTAIAIVLAVPTGGVSVNWQLFFTVQGIKAAAYALLINYINVLIYKELLKFVDKKFGLEIAFIVSAAFIIYGKFGKTFSMPKLPFAENLLAVGSTIWSSTNSYIQDQAKELKVDFLNLNNEMDKAQKELDKAKELLNVDADLDPWLFVNPLPDLMFGHSADTFISIRVHNSNPGIASLSAPSNYVDLMLTLPTIDDTLTK